MKLAGCKALAGSVIKGLVETRVSGWMSGWMMGSVSRSFLEREGEPEQCLKHGE